MHDARSVSRSALAPGIPQIVRIHACTTFAEGAWECAACDFRGDLHAAIRHVVEEQWDHAWWPR